MAKFCSWCGTALEPGARYCNECGARVMESVMVDGSRDAVDKMRGFDIVDGQELPADATAKLDRSLMESDTVVVPTDTEQKKFALDTPQAKRKAGLVVLCMVGVLLIAAVAFGAFHFGANQGEVAAPMEVTGVEEPEPQPAKAEAEPAKEEPPAPTDADIFAALDTAYQALEGEGEEDKNSFEYRIGELIDDFNTYFLDPDMDARTKAKEKADKVMADLEEGKKTVEALQLPKDSVYAEDVATIAKLYEYQIGRLKSLTDAWALDVTFDKPVQHQDEILAELSKDYENGVSSYLTQYDELYASYTFQQKH